MGVGEIIAFMQLALLVKAYCDLICVFPKISIHNHMTLPQFNRIGMNPTYPKTAFDPDNRICTMMAIFRPKICSSVSQYAELKHVSKPIFYACKVDIPNSEYNEETEYFYLKDKNKVYNISFEELFCSKLTNCLESGIYYLVVHVNDKPIYLKATLAPGKVKLIGVRSWLRNKFRHLNSKRIRNRRLMPIPLQ